MTYSAVARRIWGLPDRSLGGADSSEAAPFLQQTGGPGALNVGSSGEAHHGRHRLGGDVHQSTFPAAVAFMVLSAL